MSMVYRCILCGATTRPVNPDTAQESPELCALCAMKALNEEQRGEVWDGIVHAPSPLMRADSAAHLDAIEKAREWARLQRRESQINYEVSLFRLQLTNYEAVRAEFGEDIT